MQVLQGIAVSAGIAIGEALVIDNEGFVISRRTIERDAIDVELARSNCYHGAYALATDAKDLPIAAAAASFSK